MTEHGIQQIPHAREEDLVVQELPGELLVYDLKTHKAHCLNDAAAIVWKHCDGETSVPELATILSQALKTPVDDAVVWHALDRLQRSELLKPGLSRPAGMRRVSRRNMMKWTLATAAALPLVTSIVSPAAAQTATCVPDAPGCTPNGNGQPTCAVSSVCCSCCCHTNTGLPADAHCANGGTCIPG